MKYPISCHCNGDITIALWDSIALERPRNSEPVEVDPEASIDADAAGRTETRWIRVPATAAKDAASAVAV